MTYHILHITSPNCRLTVDKGLLFCAYKNNDTKMIALDDIKALVVAAFGVSFSNSCLAKLLENNVVILHCDDKFKPVGLSLPLERIVRKKVFYNQIAQNEEFENDLWKRIVKCKALNQAKNLDLMGLVEHNLYKLISRHRMGWLIVCFDLPVAEKEQMKEANAFRKNLLNLGYFMLQNSIVLLSFFVF